MARIRLDLDLEQALNSFLSALLARRPVSLMVLVLAWAGPLALEAEVYKWADDQGRVQYGDVPPYDRDSEAVRIPPPPSDAAVLRSRTWLDGLQDWVGGAESDAVNEEEKQAAAQETRARKQRCNTAQRRLYVLELERPVFYVDEQGERVYLSDEERAEEIERMQKVVKSACG